jgi:uncharacterized protein involved in exopolysaccharide biosynthesis
MQNSTRIDNMANEQEISLLDILDFFGRHKKTILGVAIGAAVLSAAIAMRMPNTYTATVKVLPVQQVQYVLESGVLADELVKRFSLTQAYGAKDSLDARRSLMQATRIKKDKEGVVSIEVDDPDPARAAALANAYPEELDKKTRSLGFSEQSKQRALIEMRLASLQADIALAQTAMQIVLAALPGKMSQQLAEDEEIINNLGALRAEMDLISEADPTSLKTRKDVIRLYDRFEEMMKAGTKGNSRVKTRAEINYLDKYRQVKYLEAGAESLRKKYRALEMEDSVNVTRVIDPAVPQEGKSKPKRLQIVTLSTLAAAFFATLLLLLKQLLGNLRKEDEHTRTVP